MEPNNEKESEVIDFTRPDYTFVPNGHHEWRQQGPYIVCKSCDIQHAAWVGVKKIMVGLDQEGKPIFKNRSEVL